MIIDSGLLPLAFLVLAFLACLTVPLAAALFFSGAVLLVLNPGPIPASFAMDFSLAMRLNSPALISIPLFALAGELAVAAGITDRLLDLTDAACGRGRLAAGVRSIIGCTAFATVSGVGPAAVSAEAKRLTPALVRAGYPQDIAAGLIACAAGLSIIIPASIPLTVYAATIGAQTNIIFVASFLPGIIIAAVLVVATVIYAHQQNMRPTFRPEPLRRVGVILRHARWSVAMPILVLGMLFTGFLNAPEAAAFASAYAFLVGRFVHRSLSNVETWEILARAATGAASVLLMAGMGGLFVMLMGTCGFPDRLAETIYLLFGGRVGSIFGINIILLIAGCFLNMPAIITVVAPLLLPLAAKCHMSTPHFGVMVVMNLAIGLVTPPQAWNVTTAAKTMGVDMWRVSRGAFPFMCAMVIALALVSYLPQLSLWLPQLFGWPI